MPKTFILTGSSRGLGRSIALAVLEAGHQLAASALVLAIAELENPPVRLLAGSAVLSPGVDANRARAESDGEWAWLSRKAD